MSNKSLTLGAVPLLLVFGTAGCVTKKAFDRMAKKARFARMDADRYLDRAKACSRRTEKMENEMQLVRQELERVSAAKKGAAAQIALYRRLAARLKKLIAANHVNVDVVRGRVVLKLRAAVLFDSGKDELKPEGRKILAEIAGELKQIAGRHFQVAGHTDDQPIRRSRFGTNWALSAARAVQVARFLEGKGIASPTLSAAGFSQHHPVAPNTAEAGRKQNRRIEITLLPAIPTPARS